MDYSTTTKLFPASVKSIGRQRAPARAIVLNALTDFPSLMESHVTELLDRISGTDARSRALVSIGKSHFYSQAIDLFLDITKAHMPDGGGKIVLEDLLKSKASLIEIEGSADFELFNELYFKPLEELYELKKEIDDGFVPFASVKYIPSFTRGVLREFVENELSTATWGTATLATFRELHGVTNPTSGVVEFPEYPWLASKASRKDEKAAYIELLTSIQTTLAISDDLTSTDLLQLLAEVDNNRTSSKSILGFYSDITFFGAQALILPHVASSRDIGKRFDLKPSLDAGHQNTYYSRSDGWLNSATRPDGIENTNTVSLTKFLRSTFFSLLFNEDSGSKFEHLTLPLSAHALYPLLHDIAKREIGKFYPDYNFKSLELLKRWSDNASHNSLIFDYDVIFSNALTSDRVSYPEEIRVVWDNGIALNTIDLYRDLLERVGSYQPEFVLPNGSSTFNVSSLETAIVDDGQVTVNSTHAFKWHEKTRVVITPGSSDGILVRSSLNRSRITNSTPASSVVALMADTYSNDDVTDLDHTFEFKAESTWARLVSDLSASGPLLDLDPTVTNSLLLSDLIGSSVGTFSTRFDIKLAEIFPSMRTELGFKGSLSDTYTTTTDINFRESSVRTGTFVGKMVTDKSVSTQNEYIANFVNDLFNTYITKPITKCSTFLEFNPVFVDRSYKYRVDNRASLFSTVTLEVSQLRNLMTHPYATNFLKDTAIPHELWRSMQNEIIEVNKPLLDLLETSIRHEVGNLRAVGLLPTAGLDAHVLAILNGTLTLESYDRTRQGRGALMISSLLETIFKTARDRKAFDLLDFIYALKFIEVASEENV